MICKHGQFVRGRYFGERWLLDKYDLQYYVDKCPPEGFEKERPKNMTTNKYIWKDAQCKPCGLDRYIVNENYKCEVLLEPPLSCRSMRTKLTALGPGQPCPFGAVCDCEREDVNNAGINICVLLKDQLKVNGEVVHHVGSWQVNTASGIYELVSWCVP
jgi:hypothetical protein